MIQVLEEYLELVKITFLKHYEDTLTDEQFDTLAERLLVFGKVIMELYITKQDLYGNKFETWLKEEIISRSNSDDISIMLITTGSNKTKKR